MMSVRRAIPRVVLCVSICLPLAALASDSGLSATGDWHVEVDPLPELRQTLSDVFSSAGARIAVDLVSFDVTRAGRHEIDDDMKRSMVSHWEDAIASTIDAGVGGFREISNDEIARSTGLSLEQIRTKIIEAQPFGRRRLSQSHFGQKLIIMADESPDACDDGRGAVAAYIFAYYASPDTRKDYGNITLLLMGLGSCGSGNARAAEYVRQIKQEVTDDFVKNVDVNN